MENLGKVKKEIIEKYGNAINWVDCMSSFSIKISYNREITFQEKLDMIRIAYPILVEFEYKSVDTEEKV